jgi:MoaA/NifB/PqqE/SkfB family radical SAM enzyme
LDFLRISIYGGTEETHRQRTQNSISLEKIRSNIAAFRDYRDLKRTQRPFIYVKMIDSGNSHENQSFRDYFGGVADELMIEPVMNWNDPTEGNLAGLPQDQLLQTPYFANKKRACPFPFYTAVIHSDLQVSVCCVDWSKQLVIGDLRTQSLRDIWHGDALREIQERHLAGRRDTLDGCRTCTYLHTAPDNLDALTVDEFRNRRRPNQGASNT